MTAKQLYNETRSIPAWVEVDKERRLWKRGFMYGWLEDKNIIGWKDEEGAISGFLTDPGHIQLSNGKGEFCDDSRECKSFSLEDPDKLGTMGSLTDSQLNFGMRNFVGCLANEAPVPCTKEYLKRYADCDSGYCHKHKVQCMLWFNHSCVSDPQSCKLNKEQKKKE